MTMTWIRTIPPPQADPKLRAIYDKLYALCPLEYREEVRAVTRPDGSADSIIAAHSLLPDVMDHIFSAFGCLLSPELPLSRRQHEMITTLVSSLNRCFY
jgi:hypothetical protein